MNRKDFSLDNMSCEELADAFLIVATKEEIMLLAQNGAIDFNKCFFLRPGRRGKLYVLRPRMCFGCNFLLP